MLFLLLALITWVFAGNSDELYVVWGIPSSELFPSAGTDGASVGFLAAEVDGHMAFLRNGYWRVVDVDTTHFQHELKAIEKSAPALLKGAHRAVLSLEFVQAHVEVDAHGHTRPRQRVMTLSQLSARATLLSYSTSGEQKRKRVDPPAEWEVAVAEAVALVDAAQWAADMQELGSHNRYYNYWTGAGDGLEDAGDYLMGELTAALAPAGSRVIPVARQDPLDTTVASYNIMGGITGTLAPDRFIVVGAHMDATSDDTAEAAPGVEDNGSGCAALLQIARALGQLCAEDTTTAATSLCRTTFYFIFFTGEEAGLHGSQEFVDNLVADMGDTLLRDSLVMAHTMDMVSYWHDPSDGAPTVLIETYQRHLDYLLASYEPAAATHCVDGLVVASSNDPWGSDHMPFLDLGGDDQGVRATLVIDNDYDSYADYHKTTDTFDKVNEVIALDIIRMCIGALADFSYQDTFDIIPDDAGDDGLDDGDDAGGDSAGDDTENGARVCGLDSVLLLVLALVACFL